MKRAAMVIMAAALAVGACSTSPERVAQRSLPAPAPKPPKPSKITGAWRVIPDAGKGRAYLSGITAGGPRNVWAVGSWKNSGAAFLEHWDGARWSVTPGPKGQTGWNGISAPSAKDVWLTGNTGKDSSAFNVAHWDGQTWRTWTLDKTSAGAGCCAVSALSAADVWVTDNFTLQRWDGHVWTKTWSSPKGDVNALAAGSHDDVWAVGNNLLQHWDGSVWKSAKADGFKLTAVTARSKTDAWATGVDSASVPVTLRWNGSTWTRVANPLKAALPVALAQDGAGHVWIASTNAGNTAGFPQLAGWEGTGWSMVAYPRPLGRDDAIVGLAALPDATAVLAATRAGSIEAYGTLPR